MSYQDIVAVRIGNLVTNDTKYIAAFLESRTTCGRDFEPLSRARMKLMAAADLGEEWTRLANGRTLWRQDENGNVKEEAK